MSPIKLNKSIKVTELSGESSKETLDRGGYKTQVGPILGTFILKWLQKKNELKVGKF